MEKEENPKELEPVLAQIQHIGDLGLSKWYEVVYLDTEKQWCSFAESKTFQDGEQVVKWKYCEDCFYPSLDHLLELAKEESEKYINEKIQDLVQDFEKAAFIEGAQFVLQQLKNGEDERTTN